MKSPRFYNQPEYPSIPDSGSPPAEAEGHFYSTGVESTAMHVAIGMGNTPLGGYIGQGQLQDLANEDRDINAEDSISRCGSSTFGTSDSSTSDHIHQLETQPGISEGSSGSLPCMFALFNRCEVVFPPAHDENVWIGHILQHLKHKYPQLCNCSFCGYNFVEPISSPDHMYGDAADWGKDKNRDHRILVQYLLHIAHFHRSGIAQGGWVLDFDMLRYLRNGGYITDDEMTELASQYQRLMIYRSQQPEYPSEQNQGSRQAGGYPEAGGHSGGEFYPGPDQEDAPHQHGHQKGKGKARGEQSGSGSRDKGKGREGDKDKGKGKEGDKDKGGSKGKGKARR